MQDKPDVLITDLLMPAVHGLELRRRVRTDARPGYTYIILVSALGGREDVVRGMKAGWHAHEDDRGAAGTVGDRRSCGVDGHTGGRWAGPALQVAVVDRSMPKQFWSGWIDRLLPWRLASFRGSRKLCDQGFSAQ